MNGKRRRRSPILNNGSKTSESKKVVLAPPSLKFDHANLNISESEKQKFRSGQYEKELKDHMKKTGDISGYQGSTNVSNSKLKDTNGNRYIFVSKSCKTLIKGLQRQTYKEDTNIPNRKMDLTI